MNEKVNILGVNIDKYSIEEAAKKIYDFTNTNSIHSVFTPNSEMIMTAYRDEKFKNILNSADILTADGIGVVYASKILKNPISSRTAGYDVAMKLIQKMDSGNKSIFLFGGKPNVAKIAAKKLNEEYKNLKILGCADGYFDGEKESQIINEINLKKPDVVFVCLGVPKQEHWIYNHKDKLNTKVLMGLGGSLDVIAGISKRAPEIYQKLGIEWLYRLCKEPKRIGRMMDLPKFAFTVLTKGKKF